MKQEVLRICLKSSHADCNHKIGDRVYLDWSLLLGGGIKEIVPKIEIPCNTIVVMKSHSICVKYENPSRNTHILFKAFDARFPMSNCFLVSRFFIYLPSNKNVASHGTGNLYGHTNQDNSRCDDTHAPTLRQFFANVRLFHPNHICPKTSEQYQLL